jgi:hypothetical protein
VLGTGHLRCIFVKSIVSTWLRGGDADEIIHVAARLGLTFEALSNGTAEVTPSRTLCNAITQFV